MKLSFQKRKDMQGFGFISVWLIGSLVFFMLPLIQSFIYSFCDIRPDTGGMTGSFAGLEKYNYALNEDPNYRTYLIQVLKETLWKTPLIMLLSLFTAMLLSQKFRGRTFASAVFFLPVIIAAGPIYNIISGNMASTGNDGGGYSTMISADLLNDLMRYFDIYRISEQAALAAEAIANDIFGIIWKAGIQILMFLAAIQNIPASAREAAQIEGASGWDYFWKVLLPGVGPVFLACFIFTVIDSFTDTDNSVMCRILDMQMDWKYGEASAMAWIYFAIVLAAVGIISAIINKFVYYEVE